MDFIWANFTTYDFEYLDDFFTRSCRNNKIAFSSWLESKFPRRYYISIYDYDEWDVDYDRWVTCYKIKYWKINTDDPKYKNSICPISYQEFKSTSIVRACSKCLNLFDASSLDEWLDRDYSCPHRCKDPEFGPCVMFGIK